VITSNIREGLFRGNINPIKLIADRLKCSDQATSDYSSRPSYHPGGAVFAMADGSTRLIAYDANAIMPALATRDGGEPVSLPE